MQFVTAGSIKFNLTSQKYQCNYRKAEGHIPVSHADGALGAVVQSCIHIPVGCTKHKNPFPPSKSRLKNSLIEVAVSGREVGITFQCDGARVHLLEY